MEQLLSFSKRVNWVHAILLSTTPLIALYGVLTVPLTKPTFIWAFIYYYMTGFGITAGYHRFWSHRSYSATFPLQVYLCLTGTGAIEGSIFWWCRDHRAHHRFTDSDKDPYDAHKGLFHSHLGWMLIKKDRNKIGKTDIQDLKTDPLVQWQHRNYAWLALFFGFIFPTLVAGFGWGDWKGGYFYPGVLRLVLVHHATFCVNSLAHYFGDAPFDDNRTPRDHFITALATFGEGYHNFHHEFPYDYRNAIRFYQYDPTKWFIIVCWFFGLAYDLKTFSENEVQKGQVQMAEKKLNEKKKLLKWGVPIEELPIMTLSEVKEKVNSEGIGLMIIDGIVYDVSNFADEHPGGRGFIRAHIGKDVTKSFNGDIYNHSNAARNLASLMRVGILKPQGAPSA